MAYGQFVLVLHGHLPYVLRHGVWPHGEDWLYEAAAETYLPVLEVIGHCALHGVSPKIVMGLTPVLLEQLAHDHFKSGFVSYLEDRIERAKSDEVDFQRQGEPHLAYLATRWQTWFEQSLQQFESIGQDIPAAYAQHARDGHIEILTSAATHAYLPLLYEDASVRAQLRAGLATSHRILGFQPKGIWLPECAYRPGGPWMSPNGWAGKEDRIGIEHLVADETLTHFFLENHLIETSTSQFVCQDDQWHKVDWQESSRSPQRGWQSVHEGHRVNSDGTGPGRVTAFGRDQTVCESVWSGSIGYPADGAYLEFHKKQGERRGLRYWKVTDTKSDLGGKAPYQPDDIEGKIHEHAVHFVEGVRNQLLQHHIKTGRQGVVVATFDAELFGHWWFEGPKFLRDVILACQNDSMINMVTAQEAEAQTPSDKVVSLPQGSWGEGGDHRVWANPQVNWMWDIAYRCEANFGRLMTTLPWQSDPELASLLKKAAKELFLLQSSDWAFIITRGQAVDYGIKRFMQHVTRFETMIDMAEKVHESSGYLNRLSELEAFEVKDADLHDIIFDEIDLNWWRMS